MRSIGSLGTLAALLLGAPMAAHAQVSIKDRVGAILMPTTQQDRTTRDRNGHDKIPPGQLPPAGMCRIWIDGVPPGRQPAPTDCQTAVRTKPANARVIWGDQTPFPGKGKGKINKSDRDDDRTWDRNRDGDDDDRDHRYEDARRSGNWPAAANGSKRSAKEIAAARKAEAKSLKNHGKGKGKGGH
jgi:hypothetical protein